MLISQRLFVAFALVTALIVTASEAQSRRKIPHDMRPQKAAEPEHHTQEDKRGTAEHPLSVNIIPTIEQEADAEKENTRAKLKAADDRKLVEYTRDLVLVGIVQFAVFVLQFIAFVTQAIYMRRTVTEMQSTTGAAIRAANATEGTLGHMRDTAERQLRAYINNSRAVISNVTTGMIPEVEIEVKNWGQTPAYRVRHTANITLAIFPLNVNIPQPAAPSETTIGPGSIFFSKRG
jgi:hypothetical protein